MKTKERRRMKGREKERDEEWMVGLVVDGGMEVILVT